MIGLCKSYPGTSFLLVENIQEVCAAIDGVSRHIETSLSGSSCVYRVNGSNACKNCLDLNCSAVLTYLSARFTFTSEVSVLPCHDGNLDIPTHAINSRIMGPDGRIIFDRLSTRSFVESRVVQVLLISVRVHISANIENRGNGIFFQVRGMNMHFCNPDVTAIAYTVYIN